MLCERFKFVSLVSFNVSQKQSVKERHGRVGPGRAGPGLTSVKVARFFYEIGRKRSGINHSTLLAEECTFIEMQRLSLIVLC